MPCFLEEIILSNFRGFRNYTLKLGQFNVLIGKNSSGKTSLLQAIQLVCDAIHFLFGQGEHPIFTNVPSQVNLQSPLSRFGLSNIDLIFFKKQPEGSQILAKWDNGFQIRFSNVHGTDFKFELLENGTPIDKDELADPCIQSLITDIYSNKAVMLPPVATISPNEKFISHPEMQGQRAQGQYNETWRANLFWIYNDGDKAIFNDVSEFVKENVAGTEILPPKLSADNPPKITLEYAEDSDTYDISSSGGGLRTLISLATILTLTRASCILLDEPGAHLHSELQRKIAEMLMEYTESQNIQMVIATHSPDIIDSVPQESLLLIDRAESEAHTVDSVGDALVWLGTLTNSQAIAVLGAESIVNIEGDMDKIILSECAKILGVEFPPDPRAMLTQKGKKQLKELKYIRRGMLEFLKLDMKVAQINDLDYDSIVQQNTGIEVEEDDGVLLLTLARKEIENYLLSANVIAKAVQTELQKRGQDNAAFPSLEDEIDEIIKQSLESHKENVSHQIKPLIRENLAGHFDPSTKEKETDETFKNLWQDEEWRLRVCPGKKILKKVRTEIHKRWNIPVGTKLLCHSMEDVPEDIKTILEKLSDFLKA